MNPVTTVHMIGNAHIDPVWLWLWPEGLEATRATFRSALDRMKETPEFIFTGGQAAIYDWVKKTDLAMFGEIKEAVARGTWVIVNGWWMQPDCNVPSGEGFARQSLYGQRFFEEELGVRARIAYNVDSFGHNGMLPQILAKCGFEGYIFMRPERHEDPNAPYVFNWESPDGTRLPTAKIPAGYGMGGPNVQDKVRDSVNESRNSTGQVIGFYGVGNHGGGPTIAQIAAIKELMKEDGETKVLFSSPNAFFDAVKDAVEGGAELPVYKNELQHHASGCYSVHSEIKRNNRRSENALLAAEKLSILAGSSSGFAYPTERLTEAWRGVLFNQFHDVLAGTSFPEAYEDARNLHGVALQIARETTTFAAQSIAARIDTSWTDGYEPTIVLFNPHSHDIEEPVEVSYGFGVGWNSLKDEDENVLPTQNSTNRATPTNRRVSVFVPRIPAFGYRTYRCLKAEATGASSSLKAENLTIENDLLSVKVSAETGRLEEIRLKEMGENLLAAPGAAPLVIDDPSDTWSHGVFKFRDVIGEFVAESVKVVDNGPVRASIRVESLWGNSRIVQEFALYDGLPWIDVTVRVDWRENYKMLKLSFPLGVENPKPTYEIPFGFIERPANGEEEAFQNWLDVTGDGASGAAGLTLATDAKYSADVSEGDLRLTILRSPAFAHHNPDKIAEGEAYQFIDQGEQSFRYRLLPHAGALNAAEASRMASQLNQPPVALVESNHSGDLPLSRRGIDIESDHVSASALKRAEKRSGYVIHLHETAGTPVETMISCPLTGKSWSASFGPQEIKCFFLPDDPNAPATECNLIED